MRYILIPVKDLTRAKQRLADLLTQEERTRLAWAMLTNTFAAAASVRNRARLAVVTLYAPAIKLAEEYGMEVINETVQLSESHSVDFGSQEVQRRGATAVLRLPIDLPLITGQDIEAILTQDRSAPSIVIVPSRDGTGTNAILRRPPNLFPSHFGSGSLLKHLRAAELAQAHCTIFELPRIALDVDDPADIRELLQRGPNTPIAQLLGEMNIEERLRNV
jgi:2-phospho-L-lactate/phosphoenolpyruvate guanylyltransferase